MSIYHHPSATGTAISIDAASNATFTGGFGFTDDIIISGAVPDNVGIGRDALDTLGAGQSNVAIGRMSLQFLTTGDHNVAIGTNAGRDIVGGDNNTCLGINAGLSLTSGRNNVAIGVDSFRDYGGTFAITGYNNVIIGRMTAGGTRTATVSGDNNIAMGREAMEFFTTANYNIAIGRRSGRDITSGSQNTCVGHAAGENITTGADNVCIGEYSGGTVTGYGASICIGSDADCIGSYTVSIGNNTSADNTSAVAIGRDASAAGARAIAIGRATDAVGTDSISMGYNSEAASNSVAVGKNARVIGTTTQSVSIGTNALINQIGGGQTGAIAIGYNASITGYSFQSIAIGQSTSCNRVSQICIGDAARSLTSYCWGGIAIGHNARFNGQGYGFAYNSIAIGNSAYTRGVSCLAIGAGASVGSGTGSPQNMTAIGAGAVVTTNNTIKLGSASVTSLQCQVGLTVLSDERDKCNVIAFTDGIEIIDQLNPVRFNFDPRECYPETDFVPDGSKCDPTPRVGLLAQDVEEVQILGNCEYLNIVNETIKPIIEGNTGNVICANISQYTINMDHLHPVYINALQQLAQQNRDQGNIIANLEARIITLESV